VGIVVIVICDTLKRILYGARPIDKTTLVVELLVLALIAGEIGYKILRYFKVEHRIKRLRKKLAEGQQLQIEATSSRNPSEEWATRVNGWIASTQKQLGRYSAQASLSFQHDPGAMFNPFVADAFEAGAKTTYLRLQHCLNNLRNIIETPDVYL
jgi:hypothetical protein